MIAISDHGPHGSEPRGFTVERQQDAAFERAAPRALRPAVVKMVGTRGVEGRSAVSRVGSEVVVFEDDAFGWGHVGAEDPAVLR